MEPRDIYITEYDATRLKELAQVESVSPSGSLRVIRKELKMIRETRRSHWRWIGVLVIGAWAMGLTPAEAQTEQRVDVKIRDFTFIASQAPLMLNAPAVITIRNEDGVRHNFESPIFQGIATEVRPLASSRTDGESVGCSWIPTPAR
jgi:hypothetical protein